MARKKIWKDCYEYQRILDTLDGYWLTEESEEEVLVCMIFKHSNGEEQYKSIRWHNPNIEENTIRPYFVKATNVVSSDYYKWHDLRKNPDDLPKHEGCIEVMLNLSGSGLMSRPNPWICSGCYHTDLKEFAVNDLLSGTVYMKPLEYTQQMQNKRTWKHRIKAYVLAWREADVIEWR